MLKLAGVLDWLWCSGTGYSIKLHRLVIVIWVTGFGVGIAFADGC